MNFEEALSKLREGKKIRHPHFEEDVYLVGCYVSLKTIIDDDGKELADSFEESKERGMSITLKKGDNIHPDMYPRIPFREYVALCDKYPFIQDKLSFPTINLLLIMADDWVVMD